MLKTIMLYYNMHFNLKSEVVNDVKKNINFVF